jgi:hypothetical protein
MVVWQCVVALGAERLEGDMQLTSPLLVSGTRLENNVRVKLPDTGFRGFHQNIVLKGSIVSRPLLFGSG